MEMEISITPICMIHLLLPFAAHQTVTRLPLGLGSKAATFALAVLTSVVSVATSVLMVLTSVDNPVTVVSNVPTCVVSVVTLAFTVPMSVVKVVTSVLMEFTSMENPVTHCVQSSHPSGQHSNTGFESGNFCSQ